MKNKKWTIFVADKREAKALGKIPNAQIIITGNGMMNVAATVSKILMKKPDMINPNRVMNIGYCGSVKHHRGDLVRVSTSKLFEPSYTVKESKVRLKIGKNICYSAVNFVSDAKSIKDGLFDMELYVLARMFPKIKSWKIVSDNLSLGEYRKFDSKIVWEKARKIISDITTR